MLIATHNGSFHADETTACAILTYLFENSSIIRSRDSEELERADLIIDVSNINDEKHFDHHSKEFNQCRDNGIAYATAGLIWSKYGRDFIHKVAAQETSIKLNEKLIDKIFLRIDNEIMIAIDLNDNGHVNSYLEKLTCAQTPHEQQLLNLFSDFYQNTPGIPYIVAMANLPSSNAQNQDKSFLNTVKMLRTILTNATINAIYTEHGIEKVLKCYTGGPLLVIHERLPWTSAVIANLELFEQCKLAVYPDRDGRWRIQSLPVSKAEMFSNRLPAPLAWRGLNDGDLDKVTGLQGLRFVHRSGFTGGAHDYESCMQFAKLWLEKA